MPELFTAWGTLAISTRGMKGDITRALQQVERGAKLNPKVDTSRLNSQATKAGKEFGDRFSSGAKTAMATLAAATVGAGVVDQFRQVMSVGMDWTTNMNTLQSVTGATAEQLAKAGAAARDLGNDITIPATSANDAASAMTELAKGGFTVQQSMDAAQGSLRLAAAAQISATEAATIQSQALQAFGLDAAGAGKMSDTLANAANASSAEITDVAAAMQQAGTVANQFGLSAEDTAAAIGLLANNGIKGSDAGTLLKSSLLALTDQGNPAQGAIEQLGLTVYDAQGKFVGLHELMQQLGQASGRMTAEQYQAATATLFGSDAMRFAGVAAKDGSASYDQMRVAIDRQGAAADVAAAKTRGLPGAWERVKNAVEALQLKAYDAAEGPVTRFLDGMSGSLGDLEDKATGAGPKVAAAWAAVSTNPVVLSTWTDTVNVIASLGDTAQDVWPALLQIGQSLASASAALGVSTWQLFVNALEVAAGVLDAVTPALDTIAGLMRDHPGLVTAAAAAWLAFRTVPALMNRAVGAVSPAANALSALGQQSKTAATTFADLGGAYRTSVQWMQQANPTTSTMGRALFGMGFNAATASAHLRVLGVNARAAASTGLTALKGAASGLVGAMGGPFTLALMAAAGGIALVASASSDAKRRTRDLAESQGQLNAKTQEMYALLSTSGGGVSEGVIAKAAEQVDVLQRKFDTLRTGATAGDWFKSIVSPDNADPFAAISATLDKQHTAEKIERIKAAMQDLGTTSQSMGVLISGSSEAWAEFARNAQAAGDGGRELLAEMEPLRQQFLDSQTAARNLTPGFAGVRDAIATIADTASTAADKTNAFKTALDTLAGVQPDIQQATANYNTTIRQVSAATTELADPTKGMGQALINANGSVNTATENGNALFEALKNIKGATEEVAGAGGDLGSALAQNDQQLSALATKFGLTKEQVDAMAASYGYVPTRIETLMELQGADDTRQQLGLVQTLLSTIPAGQSITIDSITSDAESKLKSVGATVERIPGTNGQPEQIRITAPNGQVLNDLDVIIDRMASIPRTITITASATPGPGMGVGQTGSSGRTFGELQQERRPRADGAIVLKEAIVPMADGGFRQIRKPRFADIYAGRGAGTVFAEEETGGEAYIPLAVAKRRRSMRILAEVARRFGMNVMEDGGITMPSIEELKQFASGISGGGYARGGGNGDTLTGTDCSGAQATIANFITGGSGRFSTATQATALLSRGFQQGDPPPGVAAYWVGWKNGGPGGGHTAGTILDPDGGNVNVEMGGRSGGGAFGAGAAGASDFPNRAWIQLAGGEDPDSANSFGALSSSGGGGGGGQMTRTQKRQLRDAEQKVDDKAAAVESAKASLAELDTMENVTDKQRTDRLKRVERAEREHQDALDDLAGKKEEIAEKISQSGDKYDQVASGGMDGQSLGQGIFSGLLQSIGLDGSLFSNPFEWPNVKSAMALLNWGGGLLRGGEESETGGDGGGGIIPGLNIPGVTDFLKPIAAQTLEPKQLPDGVHGGSGAPPGPTFQVTANGMDPKAVTDKQNATYNGYARKHLSSVRPG